ncbi:17060_t:CDS:2 [Gigaspora margarita]|uniref:17060_t:CDS:1 n=1 Tax=Gigaspora margarita TaxID=4874 RepID=A0ABN7V2Q0_GIGMA|nr:17060_t:CDS:2 [Gigaspora margarita]
MTEEDKKNFGLFRENIRKMFQIEIENIDGKWEDKDMEDLTRRMIASLLEKPFNHAVIDRLLENQNNIRVLTYDPEKVKKKTKEFFQKQFRKRGFNSKALGEKWAQVYALLEKAQEE